MATTDKVTELNSHYQKWTEDNDKRRTRKNGWNDITDAYWGKLPTGEDWPFISRVVDPRIRTSLIEKDARLLNKKPKGKVIPRDGDADVISAEVQNSLLSFQWDNANFGGTMQEKLLISSQDTRLYGSKFALVPWREVKDGKKIKFTGNEFMPLDIRDCGMDWNADHVRNAKWFQHRSWRFIEDLENENKNDTGIIWKNLRKLKSETAKASDRRDIAYPSRVLENKGLEDRVGTDLSNPMVEIVTEYTEDKWISFAPRYNLILREIDNPYIHGKIPVAQLRYYPIQDDPLGESEVESVISLWKAIQACVCGYMDEMILKMRPPLKIVEDQVRMETLEYGPEAQWLMDRLDSVEEMRSNGEAQRWFQTSYSALTSAFNTAMGDMSQNVSNVDSFNSDKTATEIRQSVSQQNARDQRNQNELSDFIKDVMGMWISNNKQFLFDNPKKEQYVLKVMGADGFEKFKRAGLADYDIPEENMAMIQDIIGMTGAELNNKDIDAMVDAAKVPVFPIIDNPNEKDMDKIQMKPKMAIDDLEESAELIVTPEDFNGNYDFIVDVKSMEMGASAEYVQSRQQALAMIKDPVMLQLLMQEGWKPKIKDLLVETLNEGGLNDSQKFFEKIGEGQSGQGGNPEVPGLVPNQQNGGVSDLPTPDSQASLDQQMARPEQVRQ